MYICTVYRLYINICIYIHTFVRQREGERERERCRAVYKYPAPPIITPSFVAVICCETKIPKCSSYCPLQVNGTESLSSERYTLWKSEEEPFPSALLNLLPYSHA